MASEGLLRESLFNVGISIRKEILNEKKYDYRSIKKIGKKGIWFDDGFFGF